MMTVRPTMVSLMTALVRKCNSRIVRSFMCYIVTHNWTERQFVKIIYVNTECGINRVAIHSTLTPWTDPMLSKPANYDPRARSLRSVSQYFRQPLTLKSE